MTNTDVRKALKQYGQVGTQTGVEAASPHRLVQMLMEGALDKIAIAKGHMERGNVAQKGEQISLAISIIEGLRMSLDKDKGGEIAANLEALYEYMNERLLQANIKNDLQILDEVGGLMGQIKAGWDEIGLELNAAAKQAATSAGVAQARP